MLPDITTAKDVEMFMEQIAHEIDNFHPLEDFANYVCPHSYFRKYTDEEAETRNHLLGKCFDICATSRTDLFTYLLRLFKQKKAKDMAPRTRHIVLHKRKGHNIQLQLFFAQAS